MTPITQLLKRPTLPIQPTQDETGAPTVCMACSRMAIGLGRAVVNHRGQLQDAGFLCKKCIVSVGDLTKMDRLNHYELQALDAAVDAVGEWIEQRGIGTELSYYDDLDRRMLVKAAVLGFGEGVRAALRAGDVPFFEESREANSNTPAKEAA